MSGQPRRRYVILTDGYLTDRHAKTAHGVMKYGRDDVVAVIDSLYAGLNVRDVLPHVGRDAPIIGSLDEALGFSPTSLLVGVAVSGGALPKAFRGHILAAIDAGLEIVSGLHQLLNDDPEFARRAKASGARLWDVRVPPADIPFFSGAAYRVPQVVVLAVGSDAAVGKKSAMIELERAGLAAGDRPEFVATGQTGILIAGKGIVVDRVISDFITGAAEQLVCDVAPTADYALIEGQGSIFHPAFAPVTLGLLFGCAPDLLVLCYDVARQTYEDFDVRIPDLRTLIQAHEMLLAPIKPAPCAAIALNTSTLPDDAARAAIAAAEAETGLPADDVVRFGGAKLWPHIVSTARATAKRENVSVGLAPTGERSST